VLIDSFLFVRKRPIYWPIVYSIKFCIKHKKSMFVRMLF